MLWAINFDDFGLYGFFLGGDKMKRITALLLCLSMLLSMLPLGVFAAEADEMLETEVLAETLPAETTEAAEVTETVESEPTEETASETEATEETESAEVIPESTTEDLQTEETLPAETVAEETEEILPVETAAEETEEAFAEEYLVGDVQFWVPDMELLSEEEAFAGYFESLFYGENADWDEDPWSAKENAAYGIAAGLRLDEGNQRIYNALLGEIRKLANGERDSAVIAVGDYMGVLDLTLTGGKKVTAPCTPAEESDLRNVDLNIKALLTALLTDLPYELYWFDKTVGIFAIPVQSAIEGKVCYVFYFSLCDQYRKNKLTSDVYNAANYDVKTEQTVAASAAAKNARQIVTEYADLPDYEKLLAYKDSICRLTDYNKDAVKPSYKGGYDNPWQMIWVFDDDPDTMVVCEGYSKAFQYLCDQSAFINDIVCYSVTGYLNWTEEKPGDHMWNIVTVNGSSYLVDVTNCDTGFNLFLRGGTLNTKKMYAIAVQTFKYRDETNNLWGTGEDSILTLSKTDLTASNFPAAPSDPESSRNWSGETLLAAMEAAEGIYVLKANVVIDSQIVLPDSVALEVCDPYSVIITNGGSLTVSDSVKILSGAKLTVQNGGQLVNEGRLDLDAGCIAVNNGTILNNGTIASFVTFGGVGEFDGAPMQEYMSAGQFRILLNSSHDVRLDKPLILTEDLTIPSDTYVTVEAPAYIELSHDTHLTVRGNLILSGEGSRLTMEDAVLTNSGKISVEKEAVLDLQGGTYVNADGVVEILYDCDADGNATRGVAEGADLYDLHVIARTESDDAVIREAIAYVAELLEDAVEQLEEAIVFGIRFCGDMVLSSDLELPRYANAVIEEGCSLTVPEDATLTVHGSLSVNGKLIAQGNVTATGWPVMVKSQENLVNPENCSSFYYEDVALEEILVTAERNAVAVGDGIELILEGWNPSHVKYFGNYRITLAPADVAQWNVNEAGNAVVYSNGAPCEVTVTVTATDTLGEDVKNSRGSVVSVSIPLRFASESVGLFTEESKPDFYENGSFGIYPGSSLHFYANLTGQKGMVDPDLVWDVDPVSEEQATVILEDGVLSVTAAAELTEAAEVSFCVSDPNGISGSREYTVYLRPRAETVDISLDGEAVTGKTLLFDLNRQEEDVLVLMPMTAPMDACNIDGLRADGKTRQVSWKSSNKDIALVDADSGEVVFTGKKTGTVKITMTANFGSAKDVTASVSFNVVKHPQKILASKTEAALIGGSSATYAVYDELQQDKALKSSVVEWYLCDESGAPIDFHPYASVTAAGKLSTKTVADPYMVYLMARVLGDERSACLDEPVKITLYPNLQSVQIMDSDGNSVGGTTQLVDRYGEPALSWSVEPEENAVKSASWKSSEKSVATIDQNGKITVRKSGTAKFTLTLVALNDKKTTATVTMKFGVFTRDLLLSAKMADGTVIGDLDAYLEAGNELILDSGKSISFGASVVPDNVTTSGVKWSVDNKNYATVSKGVLTAKSVSNPVTVTLLVQSKDGNHVERIPVKILPARKAVTIQNEQEAYITKTTRTLQVGETLKLIASEDVTWSSDKKSVATVDADGNVTAIAKGTAEITAKTADKRSATVTVKVVPAVRDMTITTKKNVPFEVASGKSLDLVATVYFQNGSKSSKPKWSVDDTTLATISSSGKLTAAKGLRQAAEVTVTATESGQSLSQTVRILPLTTGVEIFGSFRSEISVDISNTTRKWDMLWDGDSEGPSFALSARTFPNDAMGVTWKSSDKKIATVDQEGNVTCVGSGTATITATAKDGSGKKASFKLTVSKTMDPNSLKLPETAHIGGGKSLTMTSLAGYAIDKLASNKTLTWKLTYPDGSAVPKSVATLSSKGVLKTSSVKNPLELLVTVSATDGSGETAQCLVTVYKATKGVTLYNESLKSLNKKTVTLPLNETLVILPDTTNSGGYGIDDDKTADEYIPAEKAWKVSQSKKLARVEFDGRALRISANGAYAGKSVKITLKATDGSGESAYVTVKFAAVAQAPVRIALAASMTGHSDSWNDSKMADSIEVFGGFADSYEHVFEVDAQAQKESVLRLISRKPDYLILDPLVSDGWEEILEAASAAGISVIVTRPIDADASLYAAYVGTDPVAEGKLAGNWLAEYMEGEPARILVIEGKDGDSVAEGRSAGFAAVAAQHPEWTILDSASGNGYRVMSSFCKQYDDDFDVVICHYEDMAIDAMDALAEWGIDYYGPGSAVTLIGYDATCQALENGYIHCNVESTPLIAESVVAVIRQMEEGKPWPANTVIDGTAFVLPGIESEYAVTITQEILNKRPY